MSARRFETDRFIPCFYTKFKHRKRLKKMMEFRKRKSMFLMGCDFILNILFGQGKQYIKPRLYDFYKMTMYLFIKGINVR